MMRFGIREAHETALRRVWVPPGGLAIGETLIADARGDLHTIPIPDSWPDAFCMAVESAPNDTHYPVAQIVRVVLVLEIA